MAMQCCGAGWAGVRLCGVVQGRGGCPGCGFGGALVRHGPLTHVP